MTGIDMLGKPAQNHGSKGLHGHGWVSGVLKEPRNKSQMDIHLKRLCVS